MNNEKIKEWCIVNIASRKEKLDKNYDKLTSQTIIALEELLDVVSK